MVDAGHNDTFLFILFGEKGEVGMDGTIFPPGTLPVGLTGGPTGGAVGGPRGGLAGGPRGGLAGGPRGGLAGGPTGGLTGGFVGGVLGFVGRPFGYKVVLLQFLQSSSYVQVSRRPLRFNEWHSWGHEYIFFPLG